MNPSTLKMGLATVRLSAAEPRLCSRFFQFHGKRASFNWGIGGDGTEKESSRRAARRRRQEMMIVLMAEEC